MVGVEERGKVVVVIVAAVEGGGCFVFGPPSKREIGRRKQKSSIPFKRAKCIACGQLQRLNFGFTAFLPRLCVGSREERGGKEKTLDAKAREVKDDEEQITEGARVRCSSI